MKQNNNEMLRIIKKDIGEEKKHSPASLLKLEILYIVLVIALREIKPQQT